MIFNEFEDNIIKEYWKTLIRKNISNISYNKFIKKPYIEKYIITLSILIEDNELIEKIIDFIDNNKINYEDILILINNNYELNNDEKKKFEIFCYNDNNKNKLFYKISTEIIYYQIQYFRFYETIIELLFDNAKEDNELYNFILIIIKNNKSEIKKYTNKNLKFNIFQYYINLLFNNYYNIFNILVENEFITNYYDKKEIHNLFLKNIFTNWYNIYKKDIIENNVNEKIKNYSMNSNILSKLLCLPNL
jgi:hypothetical protein